MSATPRILIVGGGIAGLSLARALQRRDVDAEIVERVATWSPGGVGIYIPANGMRALHDLGLAEPLIAAGRVNIRRRYLTSQGGTSFEVDLEDFWEGTGPCLGVTRAALHDVLLAGADDTPLRLGTTVDLVKEDAAGVDVVFSDGSQDRYDLVVGADGVRSSTRTMLFGQQPLVRSELVSTSWRFLAACPASIDCWTFYAGARAMMLIVPVGDGRAYCWAAFGARQPVTRQPDVARLVSAFHDFADPVREVTSQIDPDQLYSSPLEEVDPVVWGRGRTVLIGDAAHAMPPTMAQGAALAFEDAIVLADLLVAAPDRTAVAERLASRRHRRIMWVKDHMRRQARMLNLPYPVRKVALRMAGEQLWRRSFAPLRDPV